MAKLTAAVAILALLGSGVMTAAAEAPTATDPSLVPYASNRDSARLVDGRTLHLVCMGKGNPVVILTAGAGNWSSIWHTVQPQIARKTRVCAWDRAGMGLSTPASVQYANQRTRDLREALATRSIQGPYVLVGHSLGSYESLLFKDRTPEAVAGMVLVDPSYPGQWEIFEQVAPLTWAWIRQQAAPIAETLQSCISDLRSGVVRTPVPEPCLPLPIPAEYPRELRLALEKARLDADPRDRANRLATRLAMERSDWMRVDSVLTLHPKRNYGDMPLIVLTAEDFGDLLEDAPDGAKAETAEEAAQWRKGHAALASLSSQGVHRVVPGTEHYIQLMQPQAVIDAVNEVVDRARSQN